MKKLLTFSLTMIVMMTLVGFPSFAKGQNTFGNPWQRQWPIGEEQQNMVKSASQLLYNTGVESHIKTAIGGIIKEWVTRDQVLQRFPDLADKKENINSIIHDIEYGSSLDEINSTYPEFSDTLKKDIYNYIKQWQTTIDTTTTKQPLLQQESTQDNALSWVVQSVWIGILGVILVIWYAIKRPLIILCWLAVLYGLIKFIKWAWGN